MTASQPSPRIATIDWGRLEVDGHGAFRDAKLYPGGAGEWDWRQTGTHHVPGVQPADVAELLAHGARTVILSRGFQERLQVCPETLALLAEQGVAVEVLETGAAVARYNELRATTPAAALIHSTC